MKRRGFLATVLGALCAPFLPKIKPAGLMWRKDAFAFDWPATEAIYAKRAELVAVVNGRGYIWSADDLADRRRSGLPMLDVEAIDRG